VQTVQKFAAGIVPPGFTEPLIEELCGGITNCQSIRCRNFHHFHLKVTDGKQRADVVVCFLAVL
jgi:hypothetical protein